MRLVLRSMSTTSCVDNELHRCVELALVVRTSLSRTLTTTSCVADNELRRSSASSTQFYWTPDLSRPSCMPLADAASGRLCANLCYISPSHTVQALSFSTSTERKRTHISLRWKHWLDKRTTDLVDALARTDVYWTVNQLQILQLHHSSASRTR
jgi:hypothetical protein